MTSPEHIFDTEYGKFAVSPETDKRTFERFKKGIYVQSGDIALLRHFITPQSVVADIGAHIGTMTVPFAMSAKEVHSFEPVPSTRAYLQENIALNGLTNVVVHPYALGSQDAQAYIHVGSPIDSGQNSVSSRGEVAIEIRRLDDEITEANLLKIDAEGLECEVLQGGEQFIQMHHPVVFCEINYGQLWAHHTSPGQVGKFFTKRGYTLYVPLGQNKIGKVPSLPFITGLYHPAFFIGKSRNYAFDILAAFPKDIPQTIEVSSAFKTVCWAIANKLLPRLSIMNV